ncbi:MAG: hypothetical protein H7831_10585 [Magnetococcus sp. WYHC-3]
MNKETPSARTLSPAETTQRDKVRDAVIQWARTQGQEWLQEFDKHLCNTLNEVARTTGLPVDSAPVERFLEQQGRQFLDGIQNELQKAFDFTSPAVPAAAPAAPANAPHSATSAGRPGNEADATSTSRTVVPGAGEASTAVKRSDFRADRFKAPPPPRPGEPPRPMPVPGAESQCPPLERVVARSVVTRPAAPTAAPAPVAPGNHPPPGRQEQALAALLRTLTQRMAALPANEIQSTRELLEQVTLRLETGVSLSNPRVVADLEHIGEHLAALQARGLLVNEGLRGLDQAFSKLAYFFQGSQGEGFSTPGAAAPAPSAAAAAPVLARPAPSAAAAAPVLARPAPAPVSASRSEGTGLFRTAATAAATPNVVAPPPAESVTVPSVPTPVAGAAAPGGAPFQSALKNYFNRGGR